MPLETRYDLFISYAHKDDQGDHAGRVSALVEWIEREYERVTTRQLRVFFDIHEIRSMDDWQQRILTGLRQSRIMLAVLSPNYFASDYCRREWDEYVHQELAHALPGDGIAPIYVLKHPAFDAYNVEVPLDRWMQNLKRRQYVDCQQWWPQGQTALEQTGVREQLEKIRQQIVTRLDYAARRDASPHNLPAYNPRFVGRVDEMHQIREQLIRSQIGAITAVHGLGGIGKSALALVYGHAYGHKYPGGRFWLNCASLTDLRGAMLQTAAYRGLTFTPAELARPDECFARLKALFEAGPATLFILDNVDDPALLSPRSRRDSLPQGDQIHVLATSRLQGSALHGVAWLPVDALARDDALALLERYRPIAAAPQDDEWKAAGQIVDRIGRHALALEVVAVYLAEHPAISYRAYYTGLERDGIRIVERTGATNAEQDAELSLHVEQSLGRLLAPTLQLLQGAERLAVEYAALLPPDQIAIPWLAALVTNDYPELAADPQPGLEPPLAALWAKLRRLRLVVPGDDPRVGRMHRIVQDVVRAGMPEEAVTLLNHQLLELALQRAANLESHWGPDCVWEVVPLAAYVRPCLSRYHLQTCAIACIAAYSLYKFGRSTEARSLNKQIQETAECYLQTSPDDIAAQRILSATLDRIADLSLTEGDIEDARKLYQRCLKTRAQVFLSLPNSITALKDLSISYEKIADLYRSEGDVGQARTNYHLSLTLCQRFAQLQQDDVTAYNDLARVYERLADLSLDERDEDEAARLYELVMQIRVHLVQLMPDDISFQRGLSISYNSVADMCRKRGDRVKAIQMYQFSLDIRMQLAQKLSEDVALQRDLSVSYNRLAELSLMQGDSVESRRLYNLGLGIRSRLARMQPYNIQAQLDLSLSYERLAEVSIYERDYGEAQRLQQLCLEGRIRLSKEFPHHLESQLALAKYYHQLSEFSVQIGDNHTATERLAACFQQLEMMLTTGMQLDPQSRAVHRHLAKIFNT